MRLIDADALLAKFNKKSDIWTALTDEKTANDFALYCKVADAVEEMPTVGGWVSVKDDMPKEHPSIFAPWYGGSRWTKAMWRKESDNVLLAYKTPDTGAYVIKEGRTHDGKFYSGNITLDNNCEVTHWMEMPKPPKEETENE